ncbi:hypothetical protein [Gemmatimonas sp.]|uniref:hypothetical protein n=1 Tax=Gemmatimonas sp. TaxID=1962908 RepID=UPI00391A50E1
MRLLFRSVLLAGVATLSLAACSTDLAVTNPNNADITRALGRPSDVENLLAGGFNQVVQNTTGGSTESINSSLQVMSHENYTGLANFNMGPRAGLPRTPILNFANNPGSASVSNDWNGLSRLARSTTIALERLGTTGFTLGSAAQDLRARAYGRFVLGLALGNLALVYDSAAVVVPGGDAVPPLVRYDSVMRASLKLIDDAFADASNATASGTGGFPLPATWMNLSTGAVSADLFQRIIRSYRARFRAEVARTAAERQAVNWAQVIADAQAGITADLQIAMNPNTGWTQAWVAQHYVGTNWHVMTPMIVGMADSTGASFTAWLNQPLLSRTPFIIRTTDRRFPAGNDRAAQQASSNGGASGALLPTGVYFRNRTSANDGAAADGTWGFSWYDHARFQAFQNAARIGNFPHMVMPEMWGLIAEGAIRTGNFALAAEMINNTRVTRGGLPSVAGITDLTTPVPGDNACVPRVPVFSGGSFTTRCGNILEALKWEKRMEMAYISYGAWYFDMRGWGDLPEGTPIHFPVPWQERDVRVQKSTNMGGVGQPGGALRGTYGF